MRRHRRRYLVLLWLLMAWPVVAAPPPDASRAEIARWLGDLRDSGRDVGAPLRWRYSFDASDGRALERLSVALVGAGYEISSIVGDGGRATLHVARVELHTPGSIEQRNRELSAMARAHGSRYLGIAPP